MSEDEFSNWRPMVPEPKGYQVRPPRQWPKPEPFFELMAKHGRPRGPFEEGRVMGYKAGGTGRSIK
jgi:hypothetical protein